MCNNPYADVILGFLEPAPPEAFAPDQFCSKTGGTPVWLHRNPHTAPSPPTCSTCGCTQTFLLQIYAPIEEGEVGHDAAFHRIIYIAVCRTPSCTRTGSSTQGVTVLRAQLPRRNDFYTFNAGDVTTVPPVDPLCVLCGFGGELTCGACRGVRYCSRSCQAQDWKLGHRAACRPPGERTTGDAKQKITEARRKWRFPEMEIVTDRHPSPENSDVEDEDDDCIDDGDFNAADKGGKACEGDNDDKHQNSNNEKGKATCKEVVEMTNGEQVSPENISLNGQGDHPTAIATLSTSESSEKLVVQGTFQDADEDELPEELFRGREGVQKDHVFSKFNKVVSLAGDQVIRYERGGKPLWGSAINKCKCDDIPRCEHCGGRRLFEMQVMPQMIYLLDQQASEGQSKPSMSINELAVRFRDEMDWLTVAVFTCEKSCVVKDGEYVQEFGWIQKNR